MKNLAKAVLSVMAEVKGMEKNSIVGSGSQQYNGTKDQDVKEVFNAAMFRAGLIILPTDIEETTHIDRWEETNQYGTKMKQSVFTKVRTKYMLIHESGESIELVGYGHGVDPQDKGAGKATTYALKNLLLYSFLTPVGKIDDSDATHSDDIPVPPTPDNTNSNNTPVPQTKKKPTKTQLDKLKERISSGDTDVLKKFKEVFQLTVEQEKDLIK